MSDPLAVVINNLIQSQCQFGSSPHASISAQFTCIVNLCGVIMGRFSFNLTDNLAELITSVNNLEWSVRFFLQSYKNLPDRKTCLPSIFRRNKVHPRGIVDFQSLFENYTHVMLYYRDVLGDKAHKLIPELIEIMGVEIPSELESSKKYIEWARAPAQLDRDNDTYCHFFEKLEMRIRAHCVFTFLGGTKKIEIKEGNEITTIKAEIRRLDTDTEQVFKLSQIQDNILDHRREVFKLGNEISPVYNETSREYEVTYDITDEVNVDMFQRKFNIPRIRMRFFVFRHLYRGKWDTRESTKTVTMKFTKIKSETHQ